MVSILSGENLSLWRDKLWDKPSDICCRSAGASSGIRCDMWVRIARYMSVVEESATISKCNLGIWLIEVPTRSITSWQWEVIPSFGSDTMREDDLSSRSCRRDASFGETFPSTIAEILSRASAVFSNLENVFSRSLPQLVWDQLRNEVWKGGGYVHWSGILYRSEIFSDRFTIFQGFVFCLEDGISSCGFCKNEDHGLLLNDSLLIGKKSTWWDRLNQAARMRGENFRWSSEKFRRRHKCAFGGKPENPEKVVNRF